ncbi:peptide deformylase [Enterobacter cancerogenus]|nr:peptide deformylase [Enterobacter cancerogenus]QGG11564.1 peptide deformylase [Enterobacter cancerogenus]
MALRLPDLQDLNTVPAVLSGGATLTRPTRPEHRTCRFVGWRYAYPTYKT